MAEEDRLLVKTLHSTAVDKSHTFAGLSTLKMNKKDRHMRTLREFSVFLEETNEKVVQEVLSLSRAFRETMEELDEELDKYCRRINEDSFLLPKSEEDLMRLLENELKLKIEHRSNIVDRFAADLDRTEDKRFDMVGAELKRLVDQLIAISHQLPDDIEHIVEAEAFEMNNEIISNKNAHAQTAAGHQIKQVVLEAQCLQSWEQCRSRWRVLRHEKGLQDFRTHIGSAEFTDPSDRQKYMSRFRSKQGERCNKLKSCFDRLGALTCADISSDAVAAVQADVSAISAADIRAIQSCYDELIRLQGDLNFSARNRVESLRRELHVYGALKVEPDLHANADALQAALNDPTLSELWRLGGGLKSEFQSQVADLRHPDVIYHRMIIAMSNRMQLLTSGFTLKATFEERGRLSQLEKIRGLVTKMRTAPRAEVAGVLRSLLSELNDVIEEQMETMPALFKERIKQIAVEVAEELSAVDMKNNEMMIMMASLPKSASISSLAMSMTGKPSSTSLNRTAAMPGSSVSLSGVIKPMATESNKMVSSTSSVGGGSVGGLSRGGKAPDLSKDLMAAAADPTLVKGWNRTLGILFFSSELPSDYQLACTTSLALIEEQRQCNSYVDDVVLRESELKLRQLDKRYKRLTDQITTYLETQASAVAQAANNLCDFFLLVAKMVEKHRKAQKGVDNQSADEIWDLKEEFRFELEDREVLYESACQKIRECTKDEELQMHFQEVLGVLDGIAQSYRDYHSNACFANDKYPLMLMHDFRGYLDSVCQAFFLVPDVEHHVVAQYEQTFNETIRLNRKYFEANALAAGFERIPLPATPPFPIDGAGVHTDSTQPALAQSPNVTDPNNPPQDAFYGKCFWLLTFDRIASKFREEPEAFASVESDEVSESVVPPAEMMMMADAIPPETDDAAAKEPHPACPYIFSTCPVMPKSAAELEALQEDELEQYELTMMNNLIDIGDRDPNAVAPAPTPVVPVAKGGKKAAAVPVQEVPKTPLELMSIDELQVYIQTKKVVEAVRVRIKNEADPQYILAHPPLDPEGRNWSLVVEVPVDTILRLFHGIRESLLSALEKEAFQRTRYAEKQSLSGKAELTDELEDRIRNHWPRRGRVETQIKQPREAELLSHKEKTWRHISSIQHKMIEAQTSFNSILDEAKVECDHYVRDVTGLRNSLTGEFKNLAFLQAIDVQARGVTLTFQAACDKRRSELETIAQGDTAAIILYAKDFRKICPPQSPGVEGGYSESELMEIETLVTHQCSEIESISTSWQESVAKLLDLQQQSLKSQDEFNARYKKATQDVAMSEGLGQKYGAPRRRAQERIRSEVARDEKTAGKLDSLLAQLEFSCSEAELKNSLNASSTVSSSVTLYSQSEVETDRKLDTFGQTELFFAVNNWNLLLQVRQMLEQRVQYLSIAQGTLPTLSKVSWLSKERIALCADVGVDNGPAALELINQEAPQMLLSQIFDDVDKVCRKETKELYDKEGLGTMLGDRGVPESLHQWLLESKEKLLGHKSSYREKAWKRLWTQVYRAENILARHLVPNPRHLVLAKSSGNGSSIDIETATIRDDSSSEANGKYVTKLGAPAASIRSLLTAFIHFAKMDKAVKEAEFTQLMRIWELGREKHERLLRPRLGSPDQADELSQLDAIETQRSIEMVQHVGKFRTLLIRTLVKHAKGCLDDIGVCVKGLIEVIDSTVRQELLQVPPDTEVPKKHLTLKKLRKAQRIRELVASGAEDRSHIRVWEGINAEPLAVIVSAAQDMVLDLGSDPTDVDAPMASVATTAAVPEKKGSKKASTDKNAPVTVVEAPKPSLLSSSWTASLTSRTTVKGEVSTAHRIVMNERDEALSKLNAYISDCFLEIRHHYDSVLAQERSWNERWARQVEMLRRGTT